MRIDLTERRAKDMAKALKKALPAGAGLTYQQCLDLVANAMGTRSYQHLRPLIADAEAATASRPDLAGADDRDLIEELERRGKIPLAFLSDLPFTYGLSRQCRAMAMEGTRDLLSAPDADAPASPTVRDNARAAQAAIQKVLEGVEREVRNLEVPLVDDEPRVPFDSLRITLFDVRPAPEACLAAAAAIRKADPRVDQIRFRLSRTPLVAPPLTVEPRIGGTAVDPLSLNDPAIGAYLKAERGDDCLRELKEVDREQGGDSPGDMTLVVIGERALLFPEGDPERGPQPEGVRVGLMLPRSAIRRGKVVPGYTNGLKALLVAHFAVYLPHDPACDRPDHSRRILAHFGEGAAPRLFGTTVDITDVILDPETGSLEDKRRHLKGGRMHWTLAGAPGDKVYDVAVRDQAEAFFGKPVERLSEADLDQARTARG